MQQPIAVVSPAAMALADLSQLAPGDRIVLQAPAGARLLDATSPAEIAAFIERAHAGGLKIGLAGAIEPPDAARLLALRPDFLVIEAADALPETVALARPKQTMTTQAEVATDTILVRDFVLAVEIGAYGFEHGRTQQVRFDVTAKIARRDHAAKDMRDVFSYDVILDGIRAIVARGHIVLSEALAEAVAAHVLADGCVTSVTVRVEKLELGAGGVGVEIERP